MSYGRRKIFSDASEITAANVVEEVNAAYLVHTENRNGINELYRYYRNNKVTREPSHCLPFWKNAKTAP